MNEDEIIKTGLIYELWDDDFLGWEIDLVKLIEERPINWNLSTEYNQKEINNSTCVIHAWLWWLGKTMNTSFDLNQRKEIFQYCKDLWIFEEWVWISFSKWIDAIRKWRNANNPKNEVMSFRIIDLEIVKLALKNWYRVIGWYKGNSVYTNDFNSDWKLNWTLFKPSTYWHCVSKEWEKTVVDNYKWVLKFNTYTIEDIQKLIDNWCWYPAFYIFIDKEMNERKIPYNPWITADEKQIVIAWTNECKEEDLSFNNYSDNYYITKMLIDLSIIRNK